jgi:UDP-glucose 4-epimerase
MSGIDAIIHLAALKAAGESMEQPERYATHNLSGTLNLLNAATEAEVRHIVFSSSAAVYGEPQYVPMDEVHPTEPVNFYGFTKLAIERILAWYSQLRDLRFVSLRYFNAAGYDVGGEIRGLEHAPNNLLPLVLETIMGRHPHIEVFGTDYDTPDGSCIRDYIHVSDLADAHVRALRYLEVEDQDLTANLGTSNGLSVLEILTAAREISGVDFVVRQTGRRAGDPAVVLASAEQAKQTLGWSPQHSAVQTLLETMVRAYRRK